jgi:hypothetical protein
MIMMMMTVNSEVPVGRGIFEEVVILEEGEGEGIVLQISEVVVVVFLLEFSCVCQG